MSKDWTKWLLSLGIVALVIILFIMQKDLGKLVKLQEGKSQEIETQTIKNLKVEDMQIAKLDIPQPLATITPSQTPTPTYNHAIYQHNDCGYFIGGGTAMGAPSHQNPCKWDDVFNLTCSIHNPTVNGIPTNLKPNQGPGNGLAFYICSNCGWIFTSAAGGNPPCPINSGYVYPDCKHPETGSFTKVLEY